jgi:hypothetical protein
MEAGTAPSDDELIARNPEYAGQIRELFADMRSYENWENEGGALTSDPSPGFVKNMGI